MTLTHHFIGAETKIGIQMYQEVRGFIDSVTLNSKQAAILSNWIDGYLKLLELTNYEIHFIFARSSEYDSSALNKRK
ncbi:hypothetical protein RhiirA5_428366 [Rhizophagus irregularis]|uniref:Uncharacterized protein n=1 Tax=Rhizophagus irregularis TaxID=588596 RepID=A0A2N0P0I1_9GLOM|nr:hypothetical protein RhiirA5_428366 [Rhizophagus irregularis]